MTLLTKNSLPRRNPQAICADRARQGLHRAARALRPRLPQRHAAGDRRLSRRLRRRLLRRLAADRDDLLARRARPAGLRKRAQPRLSGGVRHALHLLAGRAGGQSDLRPDLHAGSIRASISRRGRSEMDDRDTAGRRPPPQIATLGDRTGCRRRATRFALSPLNRRRWQNFKANRRGFWSLWIFLVLFVVSLFAEFIANDKPFYHALRRQLLFPGVRQLSRDRVRRRFRDRGRLSRSVSAEADRRQGRHHDLAADPLFLRHPSISICRRRRRRSRPGC